MLYPLIIFSALFYNIHCEIILESNVVSLVAGRVKNFEIQVSNPSGGNPNKTLVLITQHDDDLVLIPNSFDIRFDNSLKPLKCKVKMIPLKVGKSEISIVTATLLPNVVCEDNVMLTVKIYRSQFIESLSRVLGWLYFLAWSCSSYPQIYINYKRKSVVGLSLDFILFNLFGYIMYNAFTMGMFFVPIIKEQYSLRYSRSVNPVYPNDLFFTVHSLLATIITTVQCLKYEKGNQTVSIFAKIVLAVDSLAIFIFCILGSCNSVLWLDVLYLCSYIKLIVTVTKYLPQVFMNYKRKTTQGFSIGSVALDFIGGVLSILQMLLDAYNYGDWTLLLENPTKFGLGIISSTFDVIFFVQHCSLYPGRLADEANQNEINLNSITRREF